MLKHYLKALILVSFICWVFIYTYLLGSHNSPDQNSILPFSVNELNNVELHLKEELADRGDVSERVNEFIEQNLVQEKQQATENELNQKAEKQKIDAISAHSDNAIAVLVIACNRVTVTRCLDQILEYRPSAEEFPVLVSQDGHEGLAGHKATTLAIRGYGDQVHFMQQPDQSEIQTLPTEKGFVDYYKISRHYRWALNQTFNVFNFSTVIIIEDDLDISKDIFEYFKATLPLLQKDPSLWCVSAWNDNGKSTLIERDAASLLYRTDFFPGLGWMLTKQIWQELMEKWPLRFWDDWMREPAQRKGRCCIRPEICRTRTFGKIGVSGGQFYEEHLKYIQLNEEYVHFTELDLSFLLKENYDEEFMKTVYECPAVSYEELRSNSIATSGPVRITYSSKYQFRNTARMLGLMDDLRSAIPRAGFKGVVSFSYNNRRVYLAPKAQG